MRRLAMMLTLATGLVGASDVIAANGKNYAATACVPWQGAWSFGAASGTIVNNSGSGWLGVDCPAVKDESTTIQFGWVRLLDRNSSNPITCQLMHVHTNGANVVAKGTGAEASVDSANWEQLNVTASDYFVDDKSAYFFSCSVPPVGAAASGLQAYHVEEN
jgi:hypothetical protein